MYKIDHIAKKEMSRKEFLTVVGLGVASIFGIANFLRILSNQFTPVSHGYGSSKYGGDKR